MLPSPVNKKLSNLIYLPWYPFLFSAYPTLALLVNNVAEINYPAGTRTIILALVGTLAIFLVFRQAFHNPHRAAFACALFLFLFFAYGHIFNIITDNWEINNLHSWLLGPWAALLILFSLWVFRWTTNYEKSTPILNSLSLGLVILSIGQIVHWSFPRKVRMLGAEFAPIQSLQIRDDKTPPDIYYIILDSYARADLLERAYGYDNTEFEEQLQEMGFYVAACSQSNYLRTETSLASSLNMDYLQNLDRAFQDPTKYRRRPLWQALRYGAVRWMLEEAGYRTIAFSTGFAWSELDDADVYLTPPLLWSNLTEFEALLLRTTLVRPLGDAGIINFEAIAGDRFRERTLYVFDQFEELAQEPGPKFVFIHIIQPHPPFVFGPAGEHIDPEVFLNENNRYTSQAYSEGYQNQVTYVNYRLKSVLETLILKSATPPIIILQGDHGPWIQSGGNRFKILNAYYLPGQNDVLYPFISPVNTFRLVFNTFFNTDYEILPDISYASPVPYIFDFLEVHNYCRSD